MNDRFAMSFDELYEEFSKMVFSIVYRKIKDFHQSEDITQEVFMKLDKNMYKFHNKEYVKAWLIKVASNQAVDYIKTRVRSENEPFNEETCNGLQRDMIEENIEFWDSQNRIDKIFEKLYKKNKRWYHVIVESTYGKKSTSEMAEMFHSNPNAITSMQYRARQWLRKELLAQNEELRYLFDYMLDNNNENKNVDD